MVGLDKRHHLSTAGAGEGTLTAQVIDRDEMDFNFHTACDGHSGELQDVSCTMFDAKGKSRIPGIPIDDEASSGGFVYIETADLKGSSDEKTEALYQFLLLASNYEVGPNVGWTIATYIPDGRVGDMPNETLSEKAAYKAASAVNEAADAEPFLRLGFQALPGRQAATCSYLYLTFDKHNSFARLSPDDVAGMLQNQPPVAAGPPHNEHDDALHALKLPSAAGWPAYVPDYRHPLRSPPPPLSNSASLAVAQVRG